MAPRRKPAKGPSARRTPLQGRGRLQATFPVSITAQEGADPAAGGMFRVVAYTGAPMTLDPWLWDRPVVVDLHTLTLDQQRLPVLYDHCADIDYIVGQTETLSVEAEGLVSTGRILPMPPSGYKQNKAAQVLQLARAGYQWQVSIGADPRQVERVEAGQTVLVNGRQYAGPIAVARNTVIREVSFVVLGADRGTSAMVARKIQGGASMTFEEWLTALGFDAAAQGGLTEIQRANLQLLYDEEVAEGEVPGADNTGDGSGANPAPADPGAMPAPAAVPAAAAAAPRRQAGRIAASRQETAREIERVRQIRVLCERAGDPLTTVGSGSAARQVGLAAHAVEQGWDAARVELEILRASRPAAPSWGAGGSGPDQLHIMAAALAQTCGLPRPLLEASFPAPVLEQAHKQYRSRLGLKQLLVEAARMNGYAGGSYLRDDGEIRAVLRAAFVPSIQASTGFSTWSLPGILSNNVNKFLLAGYSAVDQSWREIASIRNVSDFKVITSYRMSGGFLFEEVGPTGEIKHETLGEAAYTNQAKTYAKMFAVTRTDIINDDLGALNDVPRRIGRGAALKFNDIFWKAILANPVGSDTFAFFSTNHLNYQTGAGTVLSGSSLALAEQAFRDMLDEDGNPMALSPSILLVPTGLNRTAQELMSSAFFIAGGSSAVGLVPQNNTYQGNYRPVVSPYLGSTAYAGSSQVAWYLFANPGDVPVVEACFLNGVETPTVETADADFDTLGVQMRGFWDFGVAMQDWHGAIKMKGSA